MAPPTSSRHHGVDPPEGECRPHPRKEGDAGSSGGCTRIHGSQDAPSALSDLGVTQRGSADGRRDPFPLGRHARFDTERRSKPRYLQQTTTNYIESQDPTSTG